MRRSHPHSKRCGMTLVEVIGAITVSGIIIGSTMGAVELFTINGTRLQLMETDRSRTSVAVHRLRSELRLAKTVTAATSTSISFTIPDTDANGFDEQAVYAWSGVAGDPLTRRLNGGTIDAIVPGVQSFALRYDVEVVTASTEVESAEVTVFSHDPVWPWLYFPVDAGNWIGECFHPNLPPEATSWKVTRLTFNPESLGLKNGRTLVQLRPVTVMDVPGASVLEQRTMLETSLSPNVWQPFSYSNVSGLSPTDGLCVVLQHAVNATSCQVAYESMGAFTPGASLVTTTDSGVTWTANAFGAMTLYVYGTYMTPTTTISPGVLKTVHVSLESQGADAASAARLDSAVVCLNRPGMGGFLLADLPILTTP